MRTKLVIGAIIVALIGSWMLSGIATGHRRQRSSPRLGATTEQVLELWVPGCGPRNGGCRFWYRLRDLDGARSGDFVTSNQPYLDADGNVVGRHRLEWLSSPNTTNDNLIGFVTFVASIRPGPHTERGTITALGFLDLRSLRDPPLRVSEMAITGGTGAYLGATGYVTEVYDPERDDLAITWHVIGVDGQ